MEEDEEEKKGSEIHWEPLHARQLTPPIGLGLLSLICHLSAGTCVTPRERTSASALRHEPAAVFIDGSRAPSSCETLSAFFPTLASANRREDSPIGRGAER